MFFYRSNIIVLLLMPLLVINAAMAQDNSPPEIHVEIPSDIQSYMGEHSYTPGRVTEGWSNDENIDVFSGGLVLSYLDVSIPGNGGLNLEVRRTYSHKAVSNFKHAGGKPSLLVNDHSPYGIGWSMHYGRLLNYYEPTLSGICDPAAHGDEDSTLNNPIFETGNGSRIPMYRLREGFADGVDSFTAFDLDGDDRQEQDPEIYNVAYASRDFKWKMDCIGEGDEQKLIVYSPDGRKNQLENLATFGSQNLKDDFYGMHKSDMWVVTDIRPAYSLKGDDAHITIEYDGASGKMPVVKSISRNDGASIDFIYDTVASKNRFYRKLKEVHAGDQIWKYTLSERAVQNEDFYKLYDENSDSAPDFIVHGFPTANPVGTPSANLPVFKQIDLDEFKSFPRFSGQAVDKAIYRPERNTLFNLTAVNGPENLNWTYAYYSNETDRFTAPPANQALLKSVTHPFGATVTYDYTLMGFKARSEGGDEYDNHAIAVKSKVVDGPGIPTASWEYEYAPGHVGASVLNYDGALTRTSIRAPEGVLHDYIFAGGRDRYNSDSGDAEAAILAPNFDREGDLLAYHVNEGDQFLKSIIYEYEEGNDLVVSNENWQKRVSVWVDGSDKAPRKSTIRKKKLLKTITLVDGSEYSREITKTDLGLGNEPVEWVEKSPGYSREVYRGIDGDDDVLTNAMNKQKTFLIKNGDEAFAISHYKYDRLARLVRSQQGGVSTYLTYGDGQGEPESSEDDLGRTWEYRDYKMGLPQFVSNPESQRIRMSVSDAGQITAYTNERGNTSNYTYDDLNRLVTVNPPAGNDTNIGYQFNASGCPAGKKTVSRGGSTYSECLDGMGRVVSTQYNGINVDYDRDALGRIIFASYPSSSNGVRYEYDGLGRLIKKTLGGTPSATVTFDYLSDNRMRVTDENNNKATFHFRSYGDPDTDRTLVKAEYPEGVSLNIQRNLRGLMTSVSNQGQAVAGNDVVNGASTDRNFTYDSRQAFIVNTYEPEVGHTDYAINAVGETIVKRINDTGRIFIYDELGRLISAKSCEEISSSASLVGTCSSVHDVAGFEYDGGLLSSSYLETSDNVRSFKQFSYDENDNLTGEFHGINADYRPRRPNGSFRRSEYSIRYEYNDNDYLTSITYPTGRRIEFSPDIFGRPTQAGEFAGAAQYNESGQLQSFAFGNGATYSVDFNSRQLPRSEIIAGLDQDILDTQYLYDALSNIKSITNNANNSLNKTMQYDGLNRLTQATGVWGDVGIAYDKLGNIRRKHNTDYSYNQNNHLESLLRPDGSVDFDYDDWGNVNRKSDSTGEKNFTFDFQNNLRQFSNDKTTIDYSYDASNQLFYKKSKNEENYLFYSQAGQLLTEYRSNSNELTVTDHIYLGRKQVAKVENTYQGSIIQTPKADKPLSLEETFLAPIPEQAEMMELIIGNELLADGTSNRLVSVTSLLVNYDATLDSGDGYGGIARFENVTIPNLPEGIFVTLRTYYKNSPASTQVTQKFEIEPREKLLVASVIESPSTNSNVFSNSTFKVRVPEFSERIELILGDAALADGSSNGAISTSSLDVTHDAIAAATYNDGLGSAAEFDNVYFPNVNPLYVTVKTYYSGVSGYKSKTYQFSTPLTFGPAEITGPTALISNTSISQFNGVDVDHPDEESISWTGPGRAYRLQIGSSNGASDYFDSGEIPRNSSERYTVTATGLPTGGEDIYVRLISYNGVSSAIGASTTHVFDRMVSASLSAPKIISPAAGDRTNARQEFVWEPLTADSYTIDVKRGAFRYTIEHVAGNVNRIALDGLPFDLEPYTVSIRRFLNNRSSEHTYTYVGGAEGDLFDGVMPRITNIQSIPANNELTITLDPGSALQYILKVCEFARGKECRGQPSYEAVLDASQTEVTIDQPAHSYSELRLIPVDIVSGLEYANFDSRYLGPNRPRLLGYKSHQGTPTTFLELGQNTIKEHQLDDRVVDLGWTRSTFRGYSYQYELDSEATFLEDKESPSNYGQYTFPDDGRLIALKPGWFISNIITGQTTRPTFYMVSADKADENIAGINSPKPNTVISADQVTFSWDKVDAASHYTLQIISLDGTGSAIFDNIPADQTSFIVDSLPESDFYLSWYAINALNRQIKGAQYLYFVEGDSSAVDDTTPPVVTPPANIQVEATGTQTPSSFAFGSATALDETDGPLTPTLQKAGSYTLGTHTVTWRATDAAGNTGTASQTITVVDTTAPVLTPPADIVATEGDTITILPEQATVSDLFAYTVGFSGPANFSVGDSIVNWTATDVNGNVATATQKVTVIAAATPNPPPVPTPTPEPIVSSPDIESLLLTQHITYGGSQDVADQGSVSVARDLKGITLNGNRWRALPINYTVTPNTVLEFNFISTQQGELHGIGIDTDLSPSANKIFTLYGTQNWGLQDYNNYQASDGNKHYTIPLGQYFSGQHQYLVFMMDDDANKAGNSSFFNIKIYEKEPEPIPDASPGILNLTNIVDVAYGGQDFPDQGSVNKNAAGNSVTLTGNRWRALPINYTVTPKTVLEFDFSSNRQGELHGIGVDNKLSSASGSSIFKLYGTQNNWGQQAFNNYANNGGGNQHYTIPLGDYITGIQRYLVLMMDDDANSGGNSRFSNIKLYERD